MKSHRTLSFAILLLASALVAACKRDAVTVYTIPKPEPTPAMSMNSGTDEAPQAMGGFSVTGKPPADWQAQPLSQMRQASFLVKGDNGATADVSLVILAGQAGGMLENINRWLSQAGKPAVTDEELAKISQHVSAPLGDVIVVDIEGLPQGADPAKDGRIIGGVAASFPGFTGFFKMRGNSALVESQKAAFIQWIQSVNIAGANSQPAETSAPATLPPQSQMPPPTAGSQPPKIKWEIPADWKPAPEKPMRYARFTAAGANGESADISISVFDGDGGGNLENVNRWRGQAGLDPIEEAGLKPLIAPVITADGDAILTVDIAGPKSHILAGWARNGGRTWFFKLTAPDKLAVAQKAAFAKFLQSVDFHP
ncbi:MAG TPA: hypothetical protein VG733_10790 [Chthoniobacteraceae bacterium]|nr:hypothetical protein [Chthoniobacteraceae bacterium]